MDTHRRFQGGFVKAFALFAFVAVMAGGPGIVYGTTDSQVPVADAGPSRYVAEDPVRLDGTGSHDPDDSGPVGYAWRQVTGPSVVIVDADAATPTISGFVQTDEIQECEFELVVSDGGLVSEPDIVRLIIVADFGASTLQQENPPFDPEKPTIIYFGGGDCVGGLSGQPWNASDWNSRANVISFPSGYRADQSYEFWRTYYHYGDMIIVYLSSVAPDYREAIQTIGWSTGGDPALDVGIRLNRDYADARYAVNHVTHLDAGCRVLYYSWDIYLQAVDLFLTSSAGGEQCWFDAYYGTQGQSHLPYRGTGFLLVDLKLGHEAVRDWYRNSLTGQDMNNFDGGVLGGAYWSVVGPGKNLQLAPKPTTYSFRWNGTVRSGQMGFYDQAQYPGRLPEPVTLVGPVDVGDSNGAVLTCAESENALRYQLLFGSDLYRVMDYAIVSDTLAPPTEVITVLPFEETWWTVRVSDSYGSIIYADPLRIDDYVLSLPIQNVTLGTRYGYLQKAIDEASDGHEIVIGQGTCHENIDLKGKSLILRSVDPDDPTVVAATVIAGGPGAPSVTSLADNGETFVLNGLTITGGTVGVSCTSLSPTMRNCTIESDTSVAIEFWHGYEPNLVDSAVVGSVAELDDPSLIAYWRLDESEGIVAQDSAGKHDGTVMGAAIWRPTSGVVDGALEFSGTGFVAADFVLNPAEDAFSVFAWVKGGAIGQVVISQQAGHDWLLLDPAIGALMTELKSAGRLGKALSSDVIVTDGDWHRIGFVWDGSNRRLYVDDVLAAEDTHDGLAGSSGKVLIGCGGKMTPVTFFTGLIDDVRIYNRVVKP